MHLARSKNVKAYVIQPLVVGASAAFGMSLGMSSFQTSGLLMKCEDHKIHVTVSRALISTVLFSIVIQVTRFTMQLQRCFAEEGTFKQKQANAARPTVYI